MDSFSALPKDMHEAVLAAPTFPSPQPPRGRETSFACQKRLRETQLVSRTNKALLALKMLWVGVFDDRILEDSVPRLGSEKSKSGRRLADRIKEAMRIVEQPEDSPIKLP